MKICMYWMQQAQRSRDNAALLAAVSYAKRQGLALLIYFGLDESYPEANERHFQFMLEGLAELKSEFEEKEIPFYVVLEKPEVGIEAFLSSCEALFMDKGYLRHQREGRKKVREKAEKEGVNYIQEIETDLIIPIEEASGKEEYMARTIRPKLQRKVSEQLALQHELTWEHEGLVAFTPETKDKIEKELKQRKIRVIQDELKQRESLLHLLATLAIDHSVKGSPCFQGGYLAAKKRLEDFVLNKLAAYNQSGSPEFDLTSKLSAYLHFGQISSMEIYRRVTQAYREKSLPEESVQGFLEQLLVRRELAFNYVYYRAHYDSFEHMTNRWAYETMKDHEADVREYQYSLEDFEQAKTHDPYWNAAMTEGIRTGHMHNYMRMYWCKKIIEWTVSYQEAYKIALYLNNRYFLDGRDANSYTGIAWCFGLHDRGWTERRIFGKLRYMNEQGLKRKFNMEAYLERVLKEEGCQLT